jgi:Ni/Co efflux regulator RcnB
MTMRKSRLPLLIAILAMTMLCPMGMAVADEPEASKAPAKDKGKAGDKAKDKGKTGSDKGGSGSDKGKTEDQPTDKDWDPGKPITGEF